MALEALIDRFGRQTEDHKEVLASCMDAEGAAKAQGLAEFKEFCETWIGEVESIQETLTELRGKVNMQEATLKNLGLDVGSVRGGDTVAGPGG